MRIELEHLMSIFEWIAAFNESFETGIASSHQIFSDATLTTDVTTTRLEEVDDKEEESKVIRLNESRHSLSVAKPKKSVKFSASTVPGQEGKEESKAAAIVPEDEDSGHDTDEHEEMQNKNALKTWRSDLISDNLDTIYIERFKGSPLSIEVSIFKQTRAHDKEKEEDKSRAAIVDLLSNLGLQFTTITAAPMQLNALEIQNIYGSQAIV